jgi:hypothetical protein
MFKIQSQSSINTDKTNLSSLSFSRIFVFKNALVLVYDDYIYINNQKIFYKTSYAKKIHPNVLMLSDGFSSYTLDFDKQSIKEESGCIKYKTIKENYLCINEENIIYGSYKIENQIKFEDFDYEGNDDTFYYTCSVNNKYFFIGTNKSSNVFLYNDKLEEVNNDMVYVQCKEDMSPLYLRGMDSNNDMIVTLDEEGNVTKYFINLVDDYKELAFKDFEGDEKNNIFERFYKKEEEICKNENKEDTTIDENKEDTTDENKEDTTIDENKEDTTIDENKEDTTIEDSVKNINFSKTEDSLFSKGDENKTGDLNKFEDLNTSSPKNSVEESVKNIFKESKNTIKEKDENRLADISKKDFSVFMNKEKVELPDFSKLNITSNDKGLKNMSNILKDKDFKKEEIPEMSESSLEISKSTIPSKTNSCMNTKDNLSFPQTASYMATSPVNTKPAQKIPYVAEILSSSTAKIISDIRSIKVNKYHSRKYKMKEFNIDTDMTELYNNILKLENVDGMRKDLEDKLLFMINNLKLRKGIDTSYVKESIKYFDNKINQKNIIKMPFVYNKGIISDMYIETKKVDKEKEEDVCKVELEKVYETGSFIIIKTDSDTKPIENKEINKTVIKNTNEKKDIQNVITSDRDRSALNTPINSNMTPLNNIPVNIPTFSFPPENSQPVQATSSDIFNQFISTGSSIPVIKKQEKKDDGKVPNAFSRFANSNNLFK